MPTPRLPDIATPAASTNHHSYSWPIGLQMRQLTPDEQELLDNRKRGFKAFHEERMPVLVHFMEVLALPEPGLVLVHAERYLPPLDHWLQQQTISDEYRAWLGARVTYFVGEYFAQILNGYWLVIGR